MKRLALITVMILACAIARAQTVTLDYYFNHEVHTNKTGQPERYHYMWTDLANSGFSILGEAFKKQGLRLSHLDVAPTFDNLSGTNIYIIVDPDTKKENPHPNYIEQNDIVEIATWVKQGGVLLMLANDSANVELPHFNKLAGVFGMHFNDDLQNHVIDDAHFEDGAINTIGNPWVHTAHKLFMKDVCSIALSGPAQAVLRNKAGAVVIAAAKYSKGSVIAVGDPWLYNEYVNGRLPAGFDNDKAADDLVTWLKAQVTPSH